MNDLQAHESLIHRIKAVFSEVSEQLRVEKDNIGLIQIYTEGTAANDQSAMHKIAHADILLFDENKEPILVIEPETSSSPKTFGRSVPVYAMADKAKIGSDSYQIKHGLLLMIVIPDHESNKHGMRTRLIDIRLKINKLLRNNDTKLKDIAICQIGDFEQEARALLGNNGHTAIAEKLGRPGT